MSMLKDLAGVLLYGTPVVVLFHFALKLLELIA